MWVQMKALEEGGTGSSSKGGFKLQDIELSLRSGELLGVVGNVGSGTANDTDAGLTFFLSRVRCFSD